MPSMSDDPHPQIAALVERAEAGDGAARDALFVALYAELHRLAEQQLRRNGGTLTLGATTLLHEAYLGMASRGGLTFPDRPRFLAYASRAMRGLVIDYVRSRHAQKRGGELTFTALDEEHAASPQPAAHLERLDRALEELAGLESPLAELVDLKFFCGFSFTEIAALRGVSERTVQRDWAKARTMLHDYLSEP
jgi:RNA polymerase sigma factor (TIGR02999 family)